MPRKKAEPEVQEARAAAAYTLLAAAANHLAGQERQPDPRTDEALMERYFALKDWTEGESKRFEAHIKPHKEEMDGITQEFLARLNARGADSTKSEFGTAYKQSLLNVSVSPDGPEYKAIDRDEPMKGRDALLEFALDHWEAYGSDMLMISAQKDAVKKFMEENEGKEPPGVKTSRFTRCNIRRS